MTDDMQRARELRKQAAKILGDAYNAAYFFGAADDALSETPSPHCQVTITAITSALRAAPEGFVPERAMLSLATGWRREAAAGGRNRAQLIRCAESLESAVIAARPQGVE